MAEYYLHQVLRWATFELNGETQIVLQCAHFENGERVWVDVPIVEITPEEYMKEE